MTKQQLREAIRKIIRQELNETITGVEAEEIARQAGSYEAAVDKLQDLGVSYQYSNAVATEIYGEELNEAKVIGKTKSGKDIYLDFNNPAHKNFTAADHDDASQALLTGKSAASISPAKKASAKQHFEASKAKQKMSEEMKTKSISNPNAGKWRIVTSDKEKPLTDKFYDSKAEAEAASRKIGKINAPGMKIIQLKDTMKVFTKENAPAPSKPSPTTKPTVAPGKPGEKEGPRRPLGNPNVNPAPKAIKATMKEAEMLKKVIQRFKAKKNA